MNDSSSNPFKILNIEKCKQRSWKLKPNLKQNSFWNLTWTRNVVDLILRKSKLWNFRLFSIPITFARKARGSSPKIPFCSPQTSTKEDRDTEAPSKNFRQGYYPLHLFCLHLLMNPLQSHSQDYHQAHPERQELQKEAI